MANDNRFSISQSIQFPTVYKHQRSIHKTNVLISETSRQQQQVELRAIVKQVFYQLLVLQQKRRLLQEADSLYSNLLKRSQQRFQAGDIDVLEKTTVQNQRQQVGNQLSLLETDYQVLQTQLKILLNSQDKPEPVADTVLYPLAAIPDTSLLRLSPALQLQQQQTQLSAEQARLEKKQAVALVYRRL